MTVHEINSQLKALKMGVSVEVLGDKLYLRATLPPKPGSKRKQPYQQRIALGINGNDEGLRRAKAEAIKLGGLIACKDFDWAMYVKNDKLTCAEWADRHRADYFNRRPDRPQTHSSYRTSYQQIFNKLPQRRILSAKILKDTLLKIPAGTRQRQRGAIAFQSLADFAGIDCDLSRYKGEYSHRSLTPRILPTDKVIAERMMVIPNAQWRWAYGMIATYGLRPHEVFFVSFQSDGVIWVSEGKTDDRHVLPLYPEWVKAFELEAVLVPPHDGADYRARDYQALGSRVTRQFQRYGVGFPPYHLRHCYARRSKEFGIKPIDAAKLMGHSLDVHFKTYHHWYSEDEVIKLSLQIATDQHRPKPPTAE
ncbi:hypothetical protein [Picosynechococcus sp. PCC 8807]|uniref:hypothetical protein n=1 Tax=Picosynechococcus sp. PCC 8807 TaxID=195248 RepID=UPI000810CDAB|nr:hypothetical protein [Picosynechococcus sp. PCC 8807]ANV90791.1 hypothetical protein AWQ24_09185 [Picosynechococcus sp. PCC 8807]